MGTRQLPTAELRLNGTPARKLSDEGGGVKQISSMLNITRLWNVLSAVAGSRRALELAKDMACRRWAFGKKVAAVARLVSGWLRWAWQIIDQMLHCETLASMELEVRAQTAMVSADRCPLGQRCGLGD